VREPDSTGTTRAQQLHAIDVGGLAADVFAAHVDDAFHAVACGNGGRGHAVLAGAGFGNHARLAHAACQQRLADDVVHLVCAGVVQVFALEVDLRAAAVLSQAGCVIDGRRTADEMLQLVLVFLDEFGIVLVARIGVAQLIQRVGQRFRNEGAAVRAEVAVGVGQVVHGNLSRHPPQPNDMGAYRRKNSGRREPREVLAIAQA